MHTAGILHRDIKPENFLLTNESTLQPNDFDLSVLVDDCSDRAAIPFAGTSSFLSPRFDKAIQNQSGVCFGYDESDDWSGLLLTFAYWADIYDPAQANASAEARYTYKMTSIQTFLASPATPQKLSDRFQRHGFSYKYNK